MEAIDDVDDARWFASHLHSMAEGFLWAVAQVPEARRTQAPPVPDFLGEWTVARHVFHMVTYEEVVALPAMRQWLGASRPDDATFLDEDEPWSSGHDLATLVARFWAVRQAQVALLAQFPTEAWTEMREAVWGPVTLKWMVSKTFQHTAEHTHDVMKLSLFWDRALARMRQSEP